MAIQWRDFQPVNNWIPDVKGEKWGCCAEQAEPKFLMDESTGRKYLNESKGIVRFKCILLTLGTPFVHPIASLFNAAYRIIKIVSLSHFWLPRAEKGYHFKARVLSACKDLLRVVAWPLTIVGLELAAIYGWIRPYDGRKLYASIERANYGNFILAPCFQPMPTSHFFGGDVNRKDAF